MWCTKSVHPTSLYLVDAQSSAASALPKTISRTSQLATATTVPPVDAGQGGGAPATAGAVELPAWVANRELIQKQGEFSWDDLWSGISSIWSDLDSYVTKYNAEQKANIEAEIKTFKENLSNLEGDSKNNLDEKDRANIRAILTFLNDPNIDAQLGPMEKLAILSGTGSALSVEGTILRGIRLNNIADELRKCYHEAKCRISSGNSNNALSTVRSLGINGYLDSSKVREGTQQEGEFAMGLMMLGMVFIPGPQEVIVGALAVKAGVALGRLGGAAARTIGRVVSTWRRACRTNSFDPKTLVRTATGLVAIAALTQGTQVLAYNEQTKQSEYQPIVEVISHGNKAQDITVLEIINQDTGTTEQIITTPGHPFYLKEAPEANRAKANAQHLAITGHPGLSSRWIAAGDLTTGDQIATTTGGGTIAGITHTTQTRTMYNLDVASPAGANVTDSFYVGESGWLVHNCDPLSPNQINKLVGKGNAPKGLDRVDVGKIKGEQTHIHFDDGAALNMNGTWKHGSTTLTKAQKEFLVKNGWKLP